MRRALVFALLLAGCATAPKPVTVVCAVAPVSYTQGDELALKVEYDALPDASQLKRWIKDYIGERQALRACSQP